MSSEFTHSKLAGPTLLQANTVLFVCNFRSLEVNFHYIQKYQQFVFSLSSQHNLCVHSMSFLRIRGLGLPWWRSG